MGSKCPSSQDSQATLDLRLVGTTKPSPFSKWLKDAHNFCNGDFSHLSDENLKMEQRQMIDDYKKVMETTPQISENDFNKYKQKHLRKVAISKALDNTPFKSLRKIKKELTQKDDTHV